MWHGGSIPFSAAVSTDSPSHLIADFPDPLHVHEWTFSQGSPYYLLGQVWGGCALGGRPDMNEMASAYENDPLFRAFIQNRVRDGLDRRAFFAACILPEIEVQSPRSPPVQALVDLTTALLTDYHRTDPVRR